MMTREEQYARHDSAFNTHLMLLEKRNSLFKQKTKLRAFLEWFEPSENIRESVLSRIKKLETAETDIDELAAKWRKIAYSILARPSTCSYKRCVDGKKVTVISEGMLPNFEITSTVESKALQMFDEFWSEEELL